MARYLIAAVFVAICLASPAQAADVERGERLYLRYCAGCHGVDADGAGAAAERLNPPPRDLTEGVYKWRSTPFDEYSPSADDFTRLILGPHLKGGPGGWSGLPGTSMPGWEGLIDGAGAADIAAYLKDLAGLEPPESPSVTMPSGGGPTPEAIERGSRIYDDLCSECHGREGRGDGMKRLRDDWGARTWPRNLTRGWTFRMGNSPEEIYRRVTVGIPGTQMPSFADPDSKKVLTDAERRDVAYYAASLDEPDRRPADGRLIRAAHLASPLPAGLNDPAWAGAVPVSLYLAPQIVALQRLYTPTIDAITVRAVYNETGLAMLLEWDDPTESIPGDAKSADLAEGRLYPDAVAVEFPSSIPAGTVKPPFGMGGPSRPVNIWHWQGGGAGGAQEVEVIDARGPDAIVRRGRGGLNAEGVYDRGRWRVAVTRSLEAVDQGADIRLEEGVFIPVAFAVWDGSNAETGGRHTMTTWCSVMLDPGSGSGRVLWPLIAGCVVACAEFFIFLGLRRKRPAG